MRESTVFSGSVAERITAGPQNLCGDGQKTLIDYIESLEMVFYGQILKILVYEETRTQILLLARSPLSGLPNNGRILYSY